jgi:long-chain fatty acid transport protein
LKKKTNKQSIPMKKIVAFLTICSPLFLKAQGFQVSLQGQKQQAMAGAGTANIQDGAALYYNPGGVSFLKQNSVSGGATPVISHAQFVDGSSSSVSETKSPVSYPFTTYMVLGKKDSRLKYGLAVYTPFGSAIKWQDGWTGRFIATRLQLVSVYFQPTVSYKISDQLGIGGGFVYGTGKVNIQRDMPVTDEEGKYGKAELNGNGDGFGFNAGIYYKPVNNLSFGLTYHSQLDMKLKKGTATFTVPASLAASFPSGNFSSVVSLPKVITLGAAYTVKKLTLAFDASLVGWNSYDTLAFDYEKNTPELEDTKSARNYKNTSSYRLGAQYELTGKLDVRAGIKYLISPVKNGFVTPEVPDATHVNYSFGMGYKFSPRFTVDASFTFQSMKRTDTNLENQLSGTYQTYIYMPGVSFNYNF